MKANAYNMLEYSSHEIRWLDKEKKKPKGPVQTPVHICSKMKRQSKVHSTQQMCGMK